MMNEHIQNRKKAMRMLDLSQQARLDLQNAERSLGSAGNWGIFDMLGGGFISTMVKHSRIDEARAHIESARPHLDQLKRELDSFSLDAGLEMQLGGFVTFADYFFDGLFADLYVQGKIRDLQADVQRTLGDLDRIDSALWKIERYEAAQMDE